MESRLDAPELREVFTEYGMRIYDAGQSSPLTRSTTLESGQTTRVENDRLLPAERSAVCDVATDDRLNYIGHGGARVVFGFEHDGKKYVVKLPRHGDDRWTDGREQNNFETGLCLGLREKDMEDDFPLLSILAADEDGYYVVQEHVATDPSAGDTETSSEYVDSVSEQLMPLSNHIHVADINEQNIGFYDGEPVMFDYGLEAVSLTGSKASA